MLFCGNAYPQKSISICHQKRYPQKMPDPNVRKNSPSKERLLFKQKHVPHYSASLRIKAQRKEISRYTALSADNVFFLRKKHIAKKICICYNQIKEKAEYMLATCTLPGLSIDG